MLGAAVYQQTVNYGAHFLSEHRTFVRPLTRNQQQVRDWLSPYDMLVFLGSDQLRMSVHSPVEPLPDGARVVQIGNRDWELAKNYPAEIALKADVKETLRALLPVLRSRISTDQAAQSARRLEALTANNWTAQRVRAQQDALKATAARPMDPRLLMLRITEALPREAVVVDEGLTASISFLSHFPVRDPHCYYGLASGAIGFAMAGAVGVSLALRDRPVMAMVGDGSAMYSIQALWTAAHLQLPLTYVIANNRSYRILKERLKAMRGSERYIGMDLREPEIDFVALAQSMGVPARRIAEPDEVVPALRAAMASGTPSLLDVRIADGFGD